MKRSHLGLTAALYAFVALGPLGLPASWRATVGSQAAAAEPARPAVVCPLAIDEADSCHPGAPHFTWPGPYEQGLCGYKAYLNARYLPRYQSSLLPSASLASVVRPVVVESAPDWDPLHEPPATASDVAAHEYSAQYDCQPHCEYDCYEFDACGELRIVTQSPAQVQVEMAPTADPLQPAVAAQAKEPVVDRLTHDLSDLAKDYRHSIGLDIIEDINLENEGLDPVAPSAGQVFADEGLGAFDLCDDLYDCDDFACPPPAPVAPEPIAPAIDAHETYDYSYEYDNGWDFGYDYDSAYAPKTASPAEVPAELPGESIADEPVNPDLLDEDLEDAACLDEECDADAARNSFPLDATPADVSDKSATSQPESRYGCGRFACDPLDVYGDFENEVESLHGGCFRSQDDCRGIPIVIFEDADESEGVEVDELDDDACDDACEAGCCRREAGDEADQDDLDADEFDCDRYDGGYDCELGGHHTDAETAADAAAVEADLDDPAAQRHEAAAALAAEVKPLVARSVRLAREVGGELLDMAVRLAEQPVRSAARPAESRTHEAESSYDYEVEYGLEYQYEYESDYDYQYQPLYENSSADDEAL